MSKILSILRAGLAASSLLLGASLSGHASPIVISSISNNPAAFSWSFNSGSGAGMLTGIGSFAISGWGTSQLDMTVTLNNTSVLAANRLTSFGFGIDPNVSSVQFSDTGDGGMVDATKSTGGNTDIPSLVGIEVCAWGGNNCSGGSNGGINGGASDTFHLLLNSATTWGNEITIDPVGFKYQTGFGSFEFTTTSSSTTSSSTTSGPTSGELPEPSSSGLAFLGLGLVAASFWARRRALR